MNIREMRTLLGETQSQFAVRYHIPFRTVQNWESGLRTPPEYVIELLDQRVRADLANRKTWFFPKYDPKKQNIPDRRKYVGALSWLKAVQECLEEPIVFALDEALMCLGCYLGHYDESLVWAYGSDALLRFNGIILLGNQISPYNVAERDGLRYTDFNRTLADALANEPVLDMQGISESLSKYYYTHGNSFTGIFVPPEFQNEFEELADTAIHYYSQGQE